ncbi:hypothetical protein FNF27_00896 [Cafeteria roenbergensis]|uniref:SLC26A/SulP transporter domain-containing protein n=1 Tax=Cafeteria roenbergensis TaxID=33653 RepID=A0A5A8EKD6_CAFRO|nr:hypothetical protein FNF27_00896 [Cafeteria roenbergensis]
MAPSGRARWRDMIPSCGDVTSGTLLAILNTFYAVAFSALLFGRGLNDYTPAATTMLLLSASVAGLVTSAASTFALSSAGPDPILVSVLFTSSAVVTAYVTDPRDAFVTIMAVMMISSAAASVACLLMGALRLGHFVYAVPGPVTAGFLAGCGFILLDESFALMGVGSFRRAARGLGSRVGLLPADMTGAAELQPGSQSTIVMLVGLSLAVALAVTSVYVPRRFSIIMPALLVGTAATVHVVLAAVGKPVALVPSTPALPGQQPWAVGAGWILATPDRAETRDVPGSDVFESLRGAWAWASGDFGRVSTSALLRELPQAIVVVPLVTVVTVLLRAVGLDVWEAQRRHGSPESGSADSKPAAEEPAAAAEAAADAGSSSAAPREAAAASSAAPPAAAGGAAGAEAAGHGALDDTQPLLGAGEPGLGNGSAGAVPKRAAFAPRKERIVGLTRFDSELFAAGFSCLSSGLVGGPPAFIEYAATVLNAAAGASGRSASVVSGLVCLLLAFSGLATIMLRAVPVPVLGGVIAYLGIHLVWEWGWRYALAAGGGASGDIFVVLVTLVGTALVGFLPGLVAGAGLTLMQHCLCSAERAAIRESYALEDGTTATEVVVLVGQLDFGAAAALVWRVQERLEGIPRKPVSSIAALCMPGRWEHFGEDGAGHAADGDAAGAGLATSASAAVGGGGGTSTDATGLPAVGADPGPSADEAAAAASPAAAAAAASGDAATPKEPASASGTPASKDRAVCRWPWPAGDGTPATGEPAGTGGDSLPVLEWLVLDMRGVTGLDRSAAAAVLKLCDVMRAAEPARSAAASEADSARFEGGSPAAGLRRRAQAQAAGPEEASAAPGEAGAAAPQAQRRQTAADAGLTRIIVVGLSRGLREFMEGSSGHGGDGDMSRTGGAEDLSHLRQARKLGALPLFCSSLREATAIVIDAQGGHRAP